MNKAEFMAIMMIAEKLNWKSVNFEVINQMIRNQQCLELDTVGKCDDDEATLLSLATCSVDKILSTQRVCDFETMVMWNVDTFCEDMGITYLDFRAMMDYYEKSPELLATEYEFEEMAMYDAYCDAWENSYC